MEHQLSQTGKKYPYLNISQTQMRRRDLQVGEKAGDLH